MHQQQQQQEEDGKVQDDRKKRVFALFYFADKTDYLLMIIGTIASCIHGMVLPIFFLIFQKLVHSFGTLSNDPRSLLPQVRKDALFLVYLGIGVLLSAWVGIACWMQTGERQAAHLREKLLQSVLKREISFFDMEAKDENITFAISSDAILVQDAIGDKIGHGLRYVSQFIFGFAIAFAEVWQLTLVTLAVVPLLAVAGGAYALVLSSLSKKGEAAYAQAGKFAEEVMSQVRTVYSFVGEDKAVERYSRLLGNALKFGKKSGFVKGAGLGIMYAVMFFSWGFLLWYSSLLVRRHDVYGSKAFMTIVNVIYSGFALGQAAPNLAAVAKSKAAVEKIISMVEAEATSKMRNDGIVLPRVEGQIDFCEVSFAYPSRSLMVFEALSFSVSPGKTVAIVGQSGSGKSTIISLIERFYNPTSGKILLDGHDLKSLQLKWLREQMGLVSQEPALFATTIAGNILFGKEDATMDEIMEAAKLSNAHSFIQSFPNGYNTQVGEGGTQLSGGQKQRIAIARALLRNPKVLLLDEATSALDAESELLVQQALNTIMLKRTTIVVAHKMSTIRDVDTIIVLKNGRIIEIGDHAELMSNGEAGEYATLVKMQVLSNIKNNQREDLGEFSEISIFPGHLKIQTLTQGPKSIDKSDIHMSCQESVPTSSPSIWKLAKLNAPEWLYALLGSVGAVLAGIEGPIFALGVGYSLNVFYSNNSSKIKHDIGVIIVILIIMAVVTVPIYLLQHYFCTLMGERLVSRVRHFMFRAILRNELGWFDVDQNSTGSLISTLAADATLVKSALADRVSTLMQNISLTVAAFVIGFKLCWQLTLLVTATFPILISASIAELLFMKGFGGNYCKVYSRATSLAHEAITNFRTVAAFGAEDLISVQFASELNQSKKQMLIRGQISGIGFGLSHCLAFCSYALGLWYASLLIKQQKSSFQDTIKTFIVLLFTAHAIADTLSLTPEIMKGSQALQSVFSILERKTAIEPDDPTSLVLTDMKGNIEFVNVTFKYPSRPDIIVLDDFNLQVTAGSSHAIVGQSGSGKSSVIALIMRFYDPTLGVITIDGHDIRGLNLKSLRLSIGLVQQEPVLFSTSIYENILYGKDGASEIEIMKAAKAANAHEFISRMPDGYQTQVGSQGTQLSGGQKQRVAIARAILKDPTILLLDEATSALDTTSEKLVQEALDKLMKGRTTVIVAHRLSTIRDVKVISVMQCGKVAETGSHEELTSQPSSIYSQLVSLQQESNGVVSS